MSPMRKTRSSVTTSVGPERRSLQHAVQDISSDEEKCPEDRGSARKLKKLKWPVMYERLRSYKDAHGDCMVPRQYPGRPKLGAWVQTQRSEYIKRKQGRKSNLTDERIYQLKKLGFDFEPRGEHEESWYNWLDQLRRYKCEFGDCCVPRDTDAWFRRLGSWLHMQKFYYNLRQQGKPSCITPERIKALESVGVKLSNGKEMRKKPTKRTARAREMLPENEDVSAPVDDEVNTLEQREKTRCSSSKTAQILSEEDNRLLVRKISEGSRIAVYWPEDDAYYDGKVKEWKKRSDFFIVTVLYDDGDVETINLYEEIFKILGD